jgi:hypothetical protein
VLESVWPLPNYQHHYNFWYHCMQFNHNHHHHHHRSRHQEVQDHKLHNNHYPKLNHQLHFLPAQIGPLLLDFEIS